MESLPDHVWIKILKISTETGRLDHTDICALAIANSHFDVLTQDSSLWATLISRDFPGSLLSFEVPSKALYRELLEIKRKYEHQMRQVHGQLLFRFAELTEEIFDDWTFPDIQLDETSFGSSSQNNTVEIMFEPPYWNFFDSITRRDVVVLPLPEEGAPALSFNANHSSLRQSRNHHYEKKPSKRFDKSSRPRVIPMSKSYIPMNRPPRRSMPRKI